MCDVSGKSNSYLKALPPYIQDGPKIWYSTGKPPTPEYLKAILSANSVFAKGHAQLYHLQPRNYYTLLMNIQEFPRPVAPHLKDDEYKRMALEFQGQGDSESAPSAMVADGEEEGEDAPQLEDGGPKRAPHRKRKWHALHCRPEVAAARANMQSLVEATGATSAAPDLDLPMIADDAQLPALSSTSSSSSLPIALHLSPGAAPSSSTLPTAQHLSPGAWEIT